MYLYIINSTDSTYVTSFYTFCRNPNEFLIHKKLSDSCISTGIFCGAHLKEMLKLLVGREKIPFFPYKSIQ